MSFWFQLRLQCLGVAMSIEHCWIARCLLCFQAWSHLSISTIDLKIHFPIVTGSLFFIYRIFASRTTSCLVFIFSWPKKIKTFLKYCSVHTKVCLFQGDSCSILISFKSENDNTFERNEDCITVFLKWTDFKMLHKMKVRKT